MSKDTNEYAEPMKIPGKHRFMAGTCVDCGRPLAETCITPASESADYLRGKLDEASNDGDYYIITKNHEALWPRGVLLFWAAERKGYSSFLEKAGRYSKEEAIAICDIRGDNFMVPCEIVEREAVRVVDIDKFDGLKRGNS